MTIGECANGVACTTLIIQGRSATIMPLTTKLSQIGVNSATNKTHSIGVRIVLNLDPEHVGFVEMKILTTLLETAL